MRETAAPAGAFFAFNRSTGSNEGGCDRLRSLRTVELQYDAAGRLDRYRDTDAGFTWRDQAYDGRGNVTSDGVHGFSYDTSGQPYAISGGASGSFVYDAHRRRVKQTLDGETIYSVYGLDGTLHFRDNITTGEATDYVRMGSHTVGRMDAAGAFTWTHGDHLGSASAATDSGGNIVWRESYTPFGEAIEDPAANRDEAGFTGHIRDHATGLTYAQARYYNPVIARFYAPDPVGFAGGGPGYFNRYAYTMNDPVNLVDPDGERPQISVSANNGRTTVSIRIPFTVTGTLAGHHADRQIAGSRISRAVSGLSGTYGRYDVSFRAEYIQSPAGGEEVSYFIPIRSGERAHVVGDTARLGPGDPSRVIQHEVGHLLGLPDRYDDVADERGVVVGSRPHAGYEDNLMANTQSGRLSESDITSIIAHPGNERTDPAANARRGTVQNAPMTTVTGSRIRRRQE